MERMRSTLRQADGSLFSLTPSTEGESDQSLLIKTIERFTPRYTPNAFILYLQDSSDKPRLYAKEHFHTFGIPSISPPLLPDLLLYQKERHILYFINAVNCQGIVTHNHKDRWEDIFKDTQFRRVYVSSFHDKGDYIPYIYHIAWGTYAWFLQHPGHIIFHW